MNGRCTRHLLPPFLFSSPPPFFRSDTSTLAHTGYTVAVCDICDLSRRTFDRQSGFMKVSRSEIVGAWQVTFGSIILLLASIRDAGRLVVNVVL